MLLLLYALGTSAFLYHITFFMQYFGMVLLGTRIVAVTLVVAVLFMKKLQWPTVLSSSIGPRSKVGLNMYNRIPDALEMAHRRIAKQSIVEEVEVAERMAEVAAAKDKSE